MLSSYESMSKGASNVTLTLTFDLGLDQGRARSKISKNYKFVQPYRVVYQVKGLGPLIPEMCFFCPYDVTGRHNDVINDVKITFFAITLVLIVIDPSCSVHMKACSKEL